jgi:hypothetical protein
MNKRIESPLELATKKKAKPTEKYYGVSRDKQECTHLSLVMLIEIGNIWCFPQISQIFGAANKFDCLVWCCQKNEILSVWCCNPMSNIFGAVK